MTTLTGELFNSKENLITKNHYEQQIISEKKDIDTNQFFVEQDGQSSEKSFTVTRFRILIIFISIIILLGCILPNIFVSNLKIYYRLIIVIISIILELILLYFTQNKIVLTKDILNKKIMIKEINYLCLAKRKIFLDIENTHFYVKYQPPIGVDDSLSTELYIFNDFKNLKEIDLDVSEIKDNPRKYYYVFNYFPKLTSDFTNELNKFIGAENFNPFQFNINDYMKKTNNSKVDEGIYIKLNNHFFIFNLYNLSNSIGSKIIFRSLPINIVIILLPIGLFGFLRYFFKINVMHIIIITLSSLIIINSVLYIVYKCVKYYKENIWRIDIIYSKDFDRIFIGLVKYTQTSYVNTFEFQMSNIDKFILQKIGNMEISYELKALLKTSGMQKICDIRNRTQEELEGLAYLLNEQLINKSYKNNKEDIN